MEEKKLYVGYAAEKITPPLGTHIPGHGFVPRLSTGVIDDIYAYAVAFSDGENKAVLFNCDVLGIRNVRGDAIRELVGARVGIPADHVMIATTHCHTSGWLGSSLSSEEPYGSYYGMQERILCDLAQFAMEDLKPATMKGARGKVEGVGFIRRFLLADGTFKTNPRYMRPDIVRPDGVQDESLQLVRFEREGGKEIVLVNFGTHPDVVGGTLYSPDWPGYVVQFLKGALGEGSEVVMLNGFGGDSNHCNRFKPKPTIPTLDFAKGMARKIAGEALKVYDDAKELPLGKVAGLSKIATVEKNPHEDWEVPIAEQIVATKAKTEKELPDELRAHKITIKKAQRILKNLQHEGDYLIPVYALQVGSLAFVGFPGEPFSETGMIVKERSCKEMTLCCCRTNGGYGYFPTRRAYEGAGYEREYTSLGPNCSEQLTDAAIEILEKMNQED